MWWLPEIYTLAWFSLIFTRDIDIGMDITVDIDTDRYRHRDMTVSMFFLRGRGSLKWPSGSFARVDLRQVES